MHPILCIFENPHRISTCHNDLSIEGPSDLDDRK